MEEAAALLRNARRVTVLTGAGISAESGIPTFRDALTGLWARYRAEELATPEAFARNPRLVWEWYRMRRERVLAAEPNAGHRALVAMQARVPSFTLVTQNVDGLHQRAGSRDVLELHGSLLRSTCAAGHITDRWEEPDEPPPACATCGARLRPDVVWFGEALPAHAMQTARDAASACDLFLSVGTSNLVQPAASLPWHARMRGATVLVVNTTMEGQRMEEGVIPLEGPAGEVLPALVAAAWPEAAG